MCDRPARGFSLIEMIIFIVVVGAGLAGILSVFTHVVKGSADAVEPKQALMVAEAKMEELLLRDYSSLAGLGTSLSGSAADIVNDIANVDMATIQGYRYKVTVQSGPLFDVAALSPAGGALSAPASANLRIDVSVSVGTTPFERLYTLTGYRFNYD